MGDTADNLAKAGIPNLTPFAQVPGIDVSVRWKNYVEQIYDIFSREVVNGHLTYKGLPIRCRYHEPYDGKHFTFWHLISEGEAEEDRTPDFERCERISWISWIIRNAKNQNLIRSWENERITSRGKKTMVPLWLVSADYVVILEKRADYYLLITSYCIEPHRKARFEQEWKEWKKKTGAAV